MALGFVGCETRGLSVSHSRVSEKIMKRSIRFLSVMIAFGAGSAMAATCYVQGEKGCVKGSLVKVDGIDQCKVGKANPELAFYLSKADCSTRRNGSVAALNSATAEIGRSEETAKTSTECYYLEPLSNGHSVCAHAKIVPTESVYAGFKSTSNSVAGRTTVCSGSGWVTSRYYSDENCRKAGALPQVCWIQKSDSTDCDSMRAGTIENTDNGIDLCKVGSGSGEMDFFFDNHCEQGNLAWKSGKSGKIPNEFKSGETGIKPIDPKFTDSPTRSEDGRMPPNGAKTGSKAN